MSKKIAIWSFALFLSASYLLWAQEKSPQSSKESCRNFVQGFYDWYLPKVRVLSGDPLQDALKYKHSVFSRELLRGLAETKAREIADKDAGLDFDPILNTQDAGDPGDPPYSVRNVARKGDKYWADVYLSDKKTEKPWVVAELMVDHGHWVFTNFHYPDSPYPQSENLLSLIRNYLAPRPGAPKKQQ